MTTERIWRVQTKNFFIWDELTQRLFLALRSVSRALEVIMLGLWLAVGLVIYFLYGFKRSRLGRTTGN